MNSCRVFSFFVFVALIAMPRERSSGLWVTEGEGLGAGGGGGSCVCICGWVGGWGLYAK